MRMEDGMIYQVVVDDKPCAMCGAGLTWTVLGPDGVCIGESFEDEIDAVETAELLSSVHAAGQEAMRERIALTYDEVEREEIRRMPIE